MQLVEHLPVPRKVAEALPLQRTPRRNTRCTRCPAPDWLVACHARAASVADGLDIDRSGRRGEALQRECTLCLASGYGQRASGVVLFAHHCFIPPDPLCPSMSSARCMIWRIGGTGPLNREREVTQSQENPSHRPLFSLWESATGQKQTVFQL